MNVPTDAELQQRADELGAVFVNESKLKDNIKKVDFHVFPESQLTVCVITMLNGFTVTGESACADPKMFNMEIGQKFAFAAAERKMWPLLGYALKQELFLSGSDFKDRLANEYNELTDKLNKLTAFIHGGVQYERLSADEQRDLKLQADIMTQYQAILNRRINRHK